jgi:hypothetical protein
VSSAETYRPAGTLRVKSRSGCLLGKVPFADDRQALCRAGWPQLQDPRLYGVGARHRPHDNALPSQLYTEQSCRQTGQLTTHVKPAAEKRTCGYETRFQDGRQFQAPRSFYRFPAIARAARGTCGAEDRRRKGQLRSRTSSRACSSADQVQSNLQAESKPIR